MVITCESVTSDSQFYCSSLNSRIRLRRHLVSLNSQPYFCDKNGNNLLMIAPNNHLPLSYKKLSTEFKHRRKIKQENEEQKEEGDSNWIHSYIIKKETVKTVLVCIKFDITISNHVENKVEESLWLLYFRISSNVFPELLILHRVADYRIVTVPNDIHQFQTWFNTIEIMWCELYRVFLTISNKILVIIYIWIEIGLFYNKILWRWYHPLKWRLILRFNFFSDISVPKSRNLKFSNFWTLTNQGYFLKIPHSLYEGEISNLYFTSYQKCFLRSSFLKWNSNEKHCLFWNFLFFFNYSPKTNSYKKWTS